MEVEFHPPAAEGSAKRVLALPEPKNEPRSKKARELRD